MTTTTIELRSTYASVDEVMQMAEDGLLTEAEFDALLALAIEQEG